MPPTGHVQKAKLVPFKRVDGKWAWQLQKNGKVVAGDASQGYSRRADCVKMANKIFGLDGNPALDVELDLDGVRIES